MPTKAFVVKDMEGHVLRAWVVNGEAPPLSGYDRLVIAQDGCELKEVSIDEALNNAKSPTLPCDAYRGHMKRPSKLD